MKFILFAIGCLLGMLFITMTVANLSAPIPVSEQGWQQAMGIIFAVVTIPMLLIVVPKYFSFGQAKYK